jgi:drug/metabolite transporter (DMT)-like permease
MMVLAMIGWGASWVNVKVLSDYIGPFELVFLRYMLTALSMPLVLLFLGKKFKIDLKSLVLSFIAAIIMVAYTYYFFMGTKYGTASLGGAFVTTLIPINTFLILVLFFKRPISKYDGFALILGAVGVMSILGVWHLSIDDIFVKHNGLFVIASLLWPILTLVSARATKVSPIVFTFYMYTFTAILSVPLMEPISLQSEYLDGIFWLNLLSLAFISTTFATTVYFLGIETLGAREVSAFIFLVPFAAIGLSALFLGEKISFWMIAGTVLTIIAVAMLNHIKLPRLRR